MFEVFLFIVISLLLSLAIDLIFGELPTKIHPVVIIESLISFFKKVFIKIKNKWSGFLTTICVMFIFSLLIIIIMLLASINDYLFIILYSVLLSSTYSIRMLLTSAKSIENDLNEDINKARQAVSYLVSRDTDELTEGFIVSATIESMTENITDSYIAPVFYCINFI